jgi:hypothetical protein
MPSTLSFTPIQTGYSSEEMPGQIVVQVEGGGSRRRQDILLPGHVVNCQWLLSATEYTEFMGFFVTELRYGRDDFLMDLITDIGVPTTHVCRTVNGIPKLTKQSGDGYWVSCTLECDKNPTITSIITYTVEADVDGQVIFLQLARHFKTGDELRIINSVGIHPDGDIPLNLDGVYTVQDTIGGNVVVLDDPSSINSDWTTLFNIDPILFAEYGGVSTGNVLSTITKVPS